MTPKALLQAAFDRRNIQALATAFDAGATDETYVSLPHLQAYAVGPTMAAVLSDWPEALRMAVARVGASHLDVINALTWMHRPHLPTILAILEFAPPGEKEYTRGVAAGIAARFGDVLTLRYFLDHGVSPDWSDWGNDGLSLLHLAKGGDTVRLLLDRGANPDGPAETAERTPPLVYAVRHGDAFRALLAWGAKLTQTIGDNAFESALYGGHYEVLRLLETYGYLPGERLLRAFQLADHGHSDACVLWLLENGGDPDIPEVLAYENDGTPLVGGRALVLRRPHQFPRSAAFLEANPAPCRAIPAGQ